MKKFLEEKLNILMDGNMHVNELIASAIVVVVILLIILLIVDKIKRDRNKEATIFSHRKNKYKNRIGKKHKF